MFHFIKGNVALLRPSLAVVETGGVGFKLTVSDRTYSAISPLYSKGEAVKLYTHLAVREDDMELFGFFDEQELDTFKLLITVSGVGPKAAMAILLVLASSLSFFKISTRPMTKKKRSSVISLSPTRPLAMPSYR